MVIHRSPIVQNFQEIFLGRKCPKETDRAIEKTTKNHGSERPCIAFDQNGYAEVCKLEINNNECFEAAG